MKTLRPFDSLAASDIGHKIPDGIVLSDLHLLSGREREGIETWLLGHQPAYAHWVFNGDILDLKWAPWPPAETGTACPGMDGEFRRTARTGRDSLDHGQS